MMAATNEPLIQLSSDQTPLDEINIYLAISSGSCTIDWGDGNKTTATGAGLTTYSHSYAGTGTYNIVIYGQTKNITEFKCFSEPISGDIAQFSMLPSLTFLHLEYSSVSGNIADLSGLALLARLQLNSTSVSGGLANLSGWVWLTQLRLASTSVTGELADLSGLTSLTTLDLYETSVSGDIANLSGLTLLTRLLLYSSSIDTYTQGVLPDWDGTVIRIQDLGLDVDEVSDFLIDLNNATGSPWNGTLDISGTNAIPNAAGLTAKGLLEGKGWSITVSI